MFSFNCYSFPTLPSWRCAYQGNGSPARQGTWEDNHKCWLPASSLCNGLCLWPSTGETQDQLPQASQRQLFNFSFSSFQCVCRTQWYVNFPPLTSDNHCRQPVTSSSSRFALCCRRVVIYYCDQICNSCSHPTLGDLKKGLKLSISALLLMGHGKRGNLHTAFHGPSRVRNSRDP